MSCAETRSSLSRTASSRDFRCLYCPCRGLEDIAEQDFDEDPDRLDTPHGLRPEDRPLPATEAELGQMAGVQDGSDLAIRLSNLQALGIPISNHVEDFIQYVTEHLHPHHHLPSHLSPHATTA